MKITRSWIHFSSAAKAKHSTVILYSSILPLFFPGLCVFKMGNMFVVPKLKANFKYLAVGIVKSIHCDILRWAFHMLESFLSHTTTCTTTHTYSKWSMCIDAIFDWIFEMRICILWFWITTHACSQRIKMYIKMLYEMNANGKQNPHTHPFYLNNVARAVLVYIHTQTLPTEAWFQCQ